MKELFKKVFYNPVKVKTECKLMGVFIAVGFVLGILYGLFIESTGLSFAAVFFTSFAAWFLVAWKTEKRFSYCYFAMVFLGGGVWLMI